MRYQSVEFSNRDGILEDRARTLLWQCVVWKPANSRRPLAVARRKSSPGKTSAGPVFTGHGPGRALGQHLAESALVDAISFTGSVPVGKKIAAAAVQNLTKVQLEMGSKNALAVMDDADLDLAVTLALGGAFGGTGQKCTASSRLVVHEKVHDAFVEKLVAGAQAMKVGHALEPGTQMGPVVSEQQLNDNLDYVKIGVSEGAELACGGARLEMPTDGYYMSPGVFVGTTNDMRINREEMFAPLTAVIKVGSLRRGAVAAVNDTKFGLTSGRHPRSARATHFRRHAQTGVVHGQLANRRHGLSRALRRGKDSFVRAARTRAGGRRILHNREDGIHQRRGPHLIVLTACNTPTGQRRSSANCAPAGWMPSMYNRLSRNFREMVQNIEQLEWLV